MYKKRRRKARVEPHSRYKRFQKKMKSSTLTEEKVQQLRNFTFEKFNEVMPNEEKQIKLVERESIKRKTNIFY